MRLTKDSLLAGAAAAVILGAMWASEYVTQHTETGGVEHVTYWEKWTGFEGDAMRDVVDTFNRKQSRIHVDLLTISGIQDKTLLAVAGGDPPDVAGLFGPNVAQYADDNAIEPLEALCASHGISAAQYIPVYWNMGVYHGHVYSVPTTPASTALHFNRQIMRESGLDPNRPPATIQELDAAAAAMTRRDASGHITRSGFLPAEPGWWNWGWGYIFGGRLWDGGGRALANSPENVAAYDWVASFARKYGKSEIQNFQSGFGSFSSPQNAFLSSKVGAELQGVWMANFIAKLAPGMDWGASPFPHPAERPDLAGTTFADEDVLVIPRGSRHKAAAFEFIAYVQSREGMELLCLGQRKHSPLTAVSPEFWKRHPNPYIKLFASLPRGKNVITPPKLGIWPEYQSEMKNAFDEIALLRMPPKEALDRVQSRMQPKLDQYRARLAMRGVK